jgi:hypothetical protein
MTLRQPAARHGGNAGIDEEVTFMVSKAIASLDAWLTLADEVLKEQKPFNLPLESRELGVSDQVNVTRLEANG